MKNKHLLLLFLLLLCGCSSPRPGAGLEKYNCIETTPQYCILEHNGTRIKLHAGREFALCNGVPLKLPVAPDYNTETKLFTVTPEVRDRILDPLFQKIVLHKAVKLIIVDAGHGGHDTGAPGAFSKEKDLNLALAIELQKALTARGFLVKLTRWNDHFIALKERVKITEKQNADLFISLHCNSARNNPKAAGVECFARKLPLPESTALAMYVQQELVQQTGFANRGVKFADFVVVKQNIPAILIETGFISNSGEEKALNTEKYRKKAAEAIASAVSCFAKPAPFIGTAGVQKSGNPSNPDAKRAVQKKSRPYGTSGIRGKNSSPRQPFRAPSADKPDARRNSQ